MKTLRKIRQALSTFGLTLLVLGMAQSASAALTLSQVPLFLSNSVEPNIVFVLDDSGSMNRGYIPDDLNNNDNGTSARAHSSDFNPMYYDPAISYLTPVDQDGVSLGAAPFANAWQNGYDHSSTKTDLSTSFRMTWAGSFAGTAQAAYYYVYDPVATSCAPVDLNNNACYRYVKVTTTSGANRFRPELAGLGGCPDPADSGVGACISANEQTNFANWYSYYRTRLYAAKAGIGRAFQSQGRGVRVGYGRINDGGSTSIDGKSVTTLTRGVRVFEDAGGNTYKKDFYDWLYGRSASGNTPLRRALDAVGRYYENTSDRSPWSSTPGDTGGEDYACRQSYTVLMTDGYWNSDSAATSDARDNNDGTTTNNDTPNIPNPSGGTPFVYTPGSPFTDTYSNTLADVAMYYWKRDLRTNLPNEVPTNTVDEAYWQHMTTFGVSFGLTGAIDPVTAFDAITNPTPPTINWPDPGTGGSTRIDDLLHAAVNGRGGFFSARDPQAFSTALSNTLSDIAERSASASAISGNSSRISTGSTIFQARFNSADWSGQLFARPIDTSGGIGTYTWEASEQLPVPALRNIVTHDGTSGVDFLFANLSGAQQTALNTLNSVNDGKGADRLNYLRGDQSKEVAQGGTFRTRTNVLGDIINSDPFFVHHANFGFQLLPGTEGDTYKTFRDSTSYQNRSPMLYFGANDGMLHGIDTDTGREKLAYVPASIYANLSELTDPDYRHRYYVDGPPRALDAYIGSTWKTVLVGTTGAGGRSVFALDVTTPDSFNDTDVMWEFTDNELGFTIGQATIIRVKNGDWLAIFGNGYNSQSERAQLFVVDLATGALVTTIDTKVGSATEPNGLASPLPVDVDGDRITDFVYAGDLRGNMWKFDFTSNTPSQWKIAYGTAAIPEPLYTACADAACSATNRQPITVRPTVGLHPDSGTMVYFGTGKYIEATDDQVPASPQIEAFYAIHDDGSPVAGRNDLQVQTIDNESPPNPPLKTRFTRDVSTNDVNYPTQKGWYLRLVPPPGTTGEGERVVTEAVLRRGRIIFVSIIPSVNPCDLGGRSWLMELDAISGKQLPYSVFDTNGDGRIDSNDVTAGGIGFGELIDRPYIVNAGDGLEYKFTSGSGGTIESILERGDPSTVGRQSWRQIR